MRNFISFLFIVCFSTYFNACKDSEETIKVDDQLSVTFNPSQYEVEIGDSIEIIPHIKSIDNNLKYLWSCEDKELGDKKSLIFIPEEVKDYILRLRISSDKEQITVECTVKTLLPKNPYRNAILTVDGGCYEFEWKRTTPFLLGAITLGGEFIPDVLEKENPSFKRSEIGQILPITLYNKRLYILSSDNHKLWKFNSETMKQEGTPIQINTEDQSFISFLVINEQDAYLSTLYAGLYHVNLQSGKMTAVNGITESYDYQFGGLFLYKDDLYLVRHDYSDTEIIAINPITKSIKETQIVESCCVSHSTINSDGCIMLPTSDGYSSASDFYFYSIVEKKIVGKISDCVASYSSGMCPVPNEPCFLYMTSEQDEVYKINYATLKGEFIIPRLPVGPESSIVGCVGLFNNRIYVNYATGMIDHEFGVYDATTGKEIKRYPMGINNSSEKMKYSGQIIQYLYNQF